MLLSSIDWSFQIDPVNSLTYKAKKKKAIILFEYSWVLCLDILCDIHPARFFLLYYQFRDLAVLNSELFPFSQSLIVSMGVGNR